MVIRRFLCAVLMFFSGFVCGQSPAVFKLLDAQTKNPIAYANAVLKQSKRGTASDINGMLRLPEAKATDTLIISYVGYQTAVLAVNQIKTTVFLKPKSYQLNSVTILAEDVGLYRLIKAVRKKRKHTLLNSKAYFHLASFQKGQRVELLEAYYNANNRGYELDGMDYKIGRLGLNPKNQAFWVSSETSKAFLFHNTFFPDTYFPDSPLEQSFREMQQRFNLRLENRYKEQGHVIYQIAFEPKKASEKLFSGVLWIDSTANVLHKATFKVVGTKVHPFDGLARTTVQSVDMTLNKTYTNHQGTQVPERIDFDYTIHFKNHYGQLDSTQTQAAFFFYDYENLFHLPLFSFTNGMHEDYRKINATPYDSYFWHHHQEFRIWGDKNEQQEFLNQQKRSAVDAVFEHADNQPGFEAPYWEWRQNQRMKFNYGRSETDKVEEIESLDRLVRGFAIGAQIYLDVNLIGDSLHKNSAAILDPFATYYRGNEAKDAKIDVLINLGFDEAEIVRRELMEQIKNETDFETISEAYRAQMNVLESKIRSRLFEVKLGLAIKQVRDWNNEVYESLQIDNITKFQLNEFYQSPPRVSKTE